jgi:SAM-dependent methyltransferase
MPSSASAFQKTAAEPSQALPFGLSHRDAIQNYFAWQARQFAAAGKVLDHGAGSGTLAAALLQSGVRELVALEPDQALCALLSRRFAAERRVTVFQGTVDEYLAHAGPSSIDTVVTSNVLEHIADDAGCLRSIRQLLTPGGRLGVYVPARNELFGSLDESVGHLRRYGARELGAKLVEAGFLLDELRYCNLVGVLPWLVAGRVLKRQALGSDSHALFDRLFPVFAAIEKRLHVPYGLNLLALCHRAR